MTWSDEVQQDDLTRLLAEWAAQYRLTARQVAAVRAEVLQRAQSESALDADWLWSLLRPVTALLEHVGELPLARQVESAYATPYLKLA
jgi:hypothetical protein